MSTINAIHWMYITNDSVTAKYVESCGVHRIFIDLEHLGKAARQGHIDTHRASHDIEDIPPIREAIRTAEVMVRVNPLNHGSEAEVAAAIDRGADRLMLPMFETARDVQDFRSLVKDRVPVTYLAETPSALVHLGNWAQLLSPRDEVHFGLNDLSLAMNLDFLFEPLAGRLLEPAITTLKELGIAFGIGGVSRVGVGELSVRTILGEHVRLGSTWAILSRAFRQATPLGSRSQSIDVEAELARLDAFVQRWNRVNPADLVANQRELAEATFAIALRRRQDG